MVTGEIKNRIDNMWDNLAAGGLTNPLEVIEQVTYLMFIHDLDENDTKHAKDSMMIDADYESIFPLEFKIGNNTIEGQKLRWSVFKDIEPEMKYKIVSDYVCPI